MTHIRLRYVQALGDRKTGRVYPLFPPPRLSRVRLPGLPGSRRVHGGLSRGIAAGTEPIGAKRSKAGNGRRRGRRLSRQHAAFRHRAPRARRSCGARSWNASASSTAITRRVMPPKFIAAVLTKKKPHAARNWLKTLRALCQFAIEQQYMREDPTRGIKLPSVKTPATTPGPTTRSRSSRRITRSAARPGSRSGCCSSPRSGAAT